MFRAIVLYLKVECSGSCLAIIQSGSPKLRPPHNACIRRQQYDAPENYSVIRKYREIMVADEANQAAYGYQCAEECSDETDGEHADVIEFQNRAVFVDVVKRCSEHDGNRQEEGKLRGGFARQAEQQAADDGRAGPRGARNQRQALCAADFQCMFPVHVIDLLDFDFMIAPLRP